MTPEFKFEIVEVDELPEEEAELAVAGLKYEVVDIGEMPDDLSEGTEEGEEILMTVAEFCAQPEVNKYPSQVYGWMKKGMPHEKAEGTTLIPFYAGLEWLASKDSKRAAPKRKPGFSVEVVDGVPTQVTSGRFVPQVAVGEYLRWDRANGLGPAYGKIVKETGELFCIEVDYRTRQVYFTKASVEHDVSSGVIHIVHPVEVAGFLLQQIARLDMLVSMVKGPETAKAVKQVLLRHKLMPEDFIARYHEDEFRRWPVRGNVVCPDCEGEIGAADSGSEKEILVCLACKRPYITKGDLAHGDTVDNSPNS